MWQAIAIATWLLPHAQRASFSQPPLRAPTTSAPFYTVVHFCTSQGCVALCPHLPVAGEVALPLLVDKVGQSRGMALDAVDTP